MFTNTFLFGQVINTENSSASGIKNSLPQSLANEGLCTIEQPFFTAATNRAAANNGTLFACIAGFPGWDSKRLSEQAATEGDAFALISAYQQYGIDLFKTISGQFVFCLYDADQQKLILALDKIGLEHVYYFQSPGGVAFSTSLAALLKHDEGANELDPQNIYNYFYFHSVPSPGTIYKNIRKLIGGQFLTVEKGRCTAETYWKPDFHKITDQSTESLGNEMLDIIENSVAQYANKQATGSFLSGGLDSSTVSGMLAKARPGDANTFSIGFDADGYDEMEYARLASRHFGTRHHEYYVTPEDVLSMVEKIAASYDEPFGNSSALPAYFCAKMAKEHGVERLLAGDGGDEIFAGNERYAKQGVFELYAKIPGVLRGALLEPLFLHNPVAKHVPLVKKVNSYISQAKLPLPDRLETYNYLHRHPADKIFSTEFLQDIDQEAPLNNLRSAYHSVEEASILNKMMLLDWKRTLHDNDLMKVNQMCELAGVEVVYPLLSDELIEFSCKIPSHIKLKNNHLRWFYKEATKNFLPYEIIHKSKQGFGLPFGIWTSTHKGLQELAYSSLYALKERGIFHEQFIDETIRMHQTVHAKYYGELVWVLMMLELWLARH